MPLPTEPAGSLPPPMRLQDAIKALDAGTVTREQPTAERVNGTGMASEKLGLPA